jgi:hypothetical protein
MGAHAGAELSIGDTVRVIEGPWFGQRDVVVRMPGKRVRVHFAGSDRQLFLRRQLQRRTDLVWRRRMSSCSWQPTRRMSGGC